MPKQGMFHALCPVLKCRGKYELISFLQFYAYLFCTTMELLSAYTTKFCSTLSLCISFCFSLPSSLGSCGHLYLICSSLYVLSIISVVTISAHSWALGVSSYYYKTRHSNIVQLSSNILCHSAFDTKYLCGYHLKGPVRPTVMFLSV